MKNNFSIYKVRIRFIKILTIFLISLIFLLNNPVHVFPSDLAKRAFLYNDIINFSGQLYRSANFNEAHSISQQFHLKCSNFNRIILPLYMDKKEGSLNLEFNLYEVEDDQKKLIHSSLIDSDSFPFPAKIGTHAHEGVLFNIWFPPQNNSKYKTFIWELVKTTPESKATKVGLYLTNKPHEQVDPVNIDGITRPREYSSFYAYCRFDFNWGDIFKTTLFRLDREKIFLGFYFLVLCGLVFYIKKIKD